MVRFNRTKEPRLFGGINGGNSGAPRETRTPDLRFRKPDAGIRARQISAVFSQVRADLGQSFRPDPRFKVHREPRSNSCSPSLQSGE